MKKVIIIFFLICITTLPVNAKQNLPEYFGVYARYSTGELIELNQTTPFGSRVSKCKTAYADFPFNFISEAPKVTLDMNKVEAFIVYGDSGLKNEYGDNNVRIFPFGKSSQLRGELWPKSERKESSYIRLIDSCGTGQGMQYKKKKQGMYVFKYPVSGGREECKLIKGKKIYHYNVASEFDVEFYGWYYEGNYWTFNIKP